MLFLGDTCPQQVNICLFCLSEFEWGVIHLFQSHCSGFPRLYVASFSLRVCALKHGSSSSTKATAYACSGLYILGNPGARTTQSHIYIFKAIQEPCMTRCEDQVHMKAMWIIAWLHSNAMSLVESWLASSRLSHNLTSFNSCKFWCASKTQRSGESLRMARLAQLARPV